MCAGADLLLVMQNLLGKKINRPSPSKLVTYSIAGLSPVNVYYKSQNIYAADGTVLTTRGMLVEVNAMTVNCIQAIRQVKCF